MDFVLCSSVAVLMFFIATMPMVRKTRTSKDVAIGCLMSELFRINLGLLSLGYFSIPLCLNVLLTVNYWPLPEWTSRIFQAVT